MASITLDPIPSLMSCSSHVLTWSSTVDPPSNLNVTLSILSSHGELHPRILVENSLDHTNLFAWNPIDVPQGSYMAQLKATERLNTDIYTSQVMCSNTTFTVETGSNLSCLSNSSLLPEKLDSSSPEVTQSMIGVSAALISKQTLYVTMTITASTMMLLTMIYLLYKWLRKHIKAPQQTYLRRRDFPVAICRRIALWCIPTSRAKIFSITSIAASRKSLIPSSSRLFDFGSMLATASTRSTSSIPESRSGRSIASDIATCGHRSSSTTRIGFALAATDPTILPSSSRQLYPIPIIPITSRASSFPDSGRTIASDIATCGSSLISNSDTLIGSVSPSILLSTPQ